MAAQVINFSAMRVARLLRQNAPADAAAEFVDHMAATARRQRDAAREAFWREVAGLVQRRAALHACAV
jgi:hypothetical protein